MYHWCKLQLWLLGVLDPIQCAVTGPCRQWWQPFSFWLQPLRSGLSATSEPFGDASGNLWFFAFFHGCYTGEMSQGLISETPHSGISALLPPCIRRNSTMLATFPGAPFPVLRPRSSLLSGLLTPLGFLSCPPPAPTWWGKAIVREQSPFLGP